MLGLSYIVSPITSLLVALWAPYHSFKAVIAENAAESKQWLTFWAILSVFTLLESFGLKFILEFVTIYGNGFYYELKAAFVIYLMFFRGAEYIFDKFIKPFMAKYQKQIDDAIAKAKELGEQASEEAANDPSGFISKYGQEVYDQAMKQKKYLEDRMGQGNQKKD